MVIIMKSFEAGKLKVQIYDDRDIMGENAARVAGDVIRKLQTEKNEINMIFAAAPSQNEFLDNLAKENGIDWSKINAYHMDEYLDLPQDAPQSFGRFLRRGFFDRVNLKSVNYINGAAIDNDNECKRYAALLKNNPPDIVCMGIGENGHIAFNDPHVAFFNDPKMVKIVELDEKCRTQQVNDGCFASLGAVPKFALTLTIPALMSAEHIFCIVPGKRKAEALKAAVMGEVNEKCPASILRRHNNAILFCDAESAEYIKS